MLFDRFLFNQFGKAWDNRCRPDVFRWVREKTCKQLKATYANVKKYHAAGWNCGALGKRQKNLVFICYQVTRLPGYQVFGWTQTT